MTRMDGANEMLGWFDGLAARDHRRWIDLRESGGREVPDALLGTLPPGRRPPPAPAHSDDAELWVTSKPAFVVGARSPQDLEPVVYRVADALWSFLGRLHRGER
jgi:hypothetical protein